MHIKQYTQFVICDKIVKSTSKNGNLEIICQVQSIFNDSIWLVKKLDESYARDLNKIMNFLHICHSKKKGGVNF